jgi:formamidopyrimidine-DNA glycosylase
VKIVSMGVIQALRDEELANSYIFRRDFNPSVLSPTDDDLTFERFSALLAQTNRALKSVLVGKDAIMVGLSNSAFQDILYRARLNPKRKASELGAIERRALFGAVRFVVSERLRLNGKDQFLDLYGRRGRYSPAMGPNMKGRKCSACGSPIEEISHGGGRVFICPKCQC